jgi:hypothetical protein
MPTPSIDNIPVTIDFPELNLPQDYECVPSVTIAPDVPEIPKPPIDVDAAPPAAIPANNENVFQAGTDNPAPQIEKKQVTLTAVLFRLQNLSVGQFFAANTDDTPEIAEQKTFFKDALTIDVEADNIVTSFAKVYALDRFMGLDTDGMAKVYGVPMEQFGERVRHKPQICLKFRELTINQEDTPIREKKLVKEISFRLMADIPSSFEDLNSLREQILNTFSGYSWLVSKDNTFTYRDEGNGYRLAIDAEKPLFTEIVTKILSIQNHTYDEIYVGKYNVNRPETPPKATVLGKEVTLPFRGRWGTVYFWKAEYKQAGIEDKIIATNILLDP